MQTAQDVAQKANLLLELDAWTTPAPTPLQQAVGGTATTGAAGRTQLLSELATADATAAAAATTLQQAGATLSPDVVVATTPLSAADTTALQQGGTISVGWQHLLAALDDLVNRNGSPPTASADGQRTPPDPPAIADALSATPSTSPTTPTTTSSSDDMLLLAIGAVVLLLVGGGLVVLRRVASPRSSAVRPSVAPSGGAPSRSTSGMDFEVLLEVSRRLSRLADAAEIHRALLREAMALSAAHTGAVVLREGDELVVACEGEPNLLVREHLADGAVGRIAETGQPMMQVSANEPSIRNLPVALIGVPLIVGGTVYAVLLLLRPATNPFGSVERDMLSALAPVAASAMLTAEQATTAVEQSLVDPLTGAGNRRRFDLDLDAALADPERQPVALIMIDLDHFKSINDTHGHPAGDAVLQNAARLVLETRRPGETVYRYGGEEFAVILPATPLADALTAAERIRRTLADDAALVPAGGGTLRVTCSLGVSASSLGHGLTAEELIAAADEALYRAKSGGRNRVCGADAATRTVV